MHKSRQLDRSTVFHARSPTDAVGVAIDFLSSPFLAASFIAACNFRPRFRRPRGRRINIADRGCTKNLGSDRLRPDVRARRACFAVSNVFQADCQFALTIRLRAGRAQTRHNYMPRQIAHVVLSSSRLKHRSLFARKLDAAAVSRLYSIIRRCC